MQAGIWLKMDQFFKSVEYLLTRIRKIILNACHWLFNGEKGPISGFCPLAKVMFPEENSHIFQKLQKRSIVRDRNGLGSCETDKADGHSWADPTEGAGGWVKAGRTEAPQLGEVPSCQRWLKDFSGVFDCQ